jgi:hypothetical protein
MPSALKTHRRRRGAVLVLSMIFIVVFSALAVALASLSNANVEVASNQYKVSQALHAAQSGLECAKYLVKTVANMPETGINYVTDAQANTVWTNLCAHVQNTRIDGKTVPAAARFTDTGGAGDQIVTPAMDFGTGNGQFTLRLYRYDGDPRTIRIQSSGTDGEATRRVAMAMDVTKDREVLSYAIASRGRMWLTGDTTIHGDLFSTWDVANISPFNMTNDSTVLGTVNTVLTLDQIEDEDYQLETLDANDHPIDANGVALSDNYEDRYYGPNDEIKAYHENINYGQPYDDMPGMDISDYNTDEYDDGLTTIAAASTSNRVTEYFPHAAGNYSRPRDSGSTSFTRHRYQNQTFTNALLPVGRHALFRNCTFNGILYVDAYKTNTSKSYTNNVRFENCTFNGVIVTDVPQTLNWVNNCLYFTGEATFNNQSSVQEATILAPHFNVNLGNTNPNQSDSNVLTGAIVGGIVDIRGNAQIYGTIISMCDTSQWTSGYVTNIGATLDDGGSETTELGDIGVIEITPEEDMMLPSGVTSPIVIKPDPKTYSEII